MLGLQSTPLKSHSMSLVCAAASAKLSEAHVTAPPPEHEVFPPSSLEHEVPPPSSPEPEVPPPGKFDLVLAHYSHSTIETTTEWWSGFLDIEMVRPDPLLAVLPGVSLPCALLSLEGQVHVHVSTAGLLEGEGRTVDDEVRRE